MSKKELLCTFESCSHRTAKRAKQEKKHLYLILDDWERGYSVYKVNVDAFDTSGAGPESLPDPVVRFEARHGCSFYFASHGTKILAMQPSPCPAFPVFDDQTQALAVCPWPRRGGNKLFVKPLFASVAGSLYLLRAESREWASHGSWILPFKGEAFFDAELDAWVGLCCHEGSKGYLSCCDVVPAPADLTSMPAWKHGKDQLFDAGSRRHLGATLVYMGGSRYCLVESLARDDEEDLRRLHDDGYYPHRRVLVVTKFGLKYDKQGQLVTTQRKVWSYEMTDAHQLPDLHWKPVAFWM